MNPPEQKKGNENMEQETPNIPILSAAAIEGREMTPEELKEELRLPKLL